VNSRILRPELLDVAEPGAARAGLRDLVRINRFLGGHSILARLAARLVRPAETFSVLDVGAASGDMGAALASRFPGARVTSLDRRALHLGNAPGARIVADAFHLPFPPASFDLVMCSLFLHHFDNTRVVELLRRFNATARRGLIVLDLERSSFASRFVPATRWLFGWSDITVHDAPASVRAGFKPLELTQLARTAGLNQPSVRRHVPWFRLSLVAYGFVPVVTPGDSVNTTFNA
jgi:SAM-dependent methyltransferase